LCIVISEDSLTRRMGFPDTIRSSMIAMIWDKMDDLAQYRADEGTMIIARNSGQRGASVDLWL